MVIGPLIGAAKAAAATYGAAAAAKYGGAAAVGGVSVFMLGVAATHDPAGDLTRALLNKPESAAECITHNVAALKGPLVVTGQPLYGTQVYGLSLKRGVTGSPVMTVLLIESDVGSNAEFTPLGPREQQPDVIDKMIAGC
ncbi:MAG TPA: hypothetical protein VED01_27150 [Burkholderiales bacterium]|nr:hypothetical protein [Burkholderiales bacterium]